VTGTRSVGVYRALLRFYPRHFRDEYGLDMALLFANQLHDEPAGRVWVRGAVDLAITVPARHLEAHMNRPPSSVVPLLFAALSAAGLLAGIAGGSNVAMLAAGAAVAMVFGVLAAKAWRQTRTVTTALPVTAQWWKLLATGAGALVAMILAEKATDLSLWWPMFMIVLASLITIAAGVLLGVVHLGIRLRHRAS
jgi:hypothetical protein